MAKGLGALGGLLGTLARYGLQGWLQQGRAAAPVFPVGTLAVNIVGSLVLGFLMRYATGSTVLSPEMRGALTVGFCGAFTTMSSFSYETMTLVGDGQYWRAALYLGGTIIGCLAAVVAGTAAANRLLRLSLDLPLIIEVVETEETIQSILPDLDAMIGGGLITLERARVIMYRPATPR